MTFAQQIEQTITGKGIFKRDDLILVALSGGADSVALLLVLEQLGYRLQALHCNFHLRGEESDRDEQFVSALCQRYHIPLHITHFDTLQYAQEHRQSIEMAARELRYRWFDEQLQALDAQAIAVGHHLDDQAETLLLNIVRGTGLRGLAGMHHVNGSICRPMLDVTKDDILTYLKDKGETFVTDSTNLEREAIRNRIRLDIMPALSEINPNIKQTLSRLSENVKDALPYFDKSVGDMLQGTDHTLYIDRKERGEHASGLTQSPFTIQEASLTLLHEWLSACGFTRTQLQNILQAETGRVVETDTHRLLRDRERFVLQSKQSEQRSSVVVSETRKVSEVGTMQKGNAYLDASKVILPIQVRRVQEADRFTPFGMKGSKLISNYLTDLKLNRFEKECQEVVTDAEGHILWVVNHAADHHFRITPHTQDVLILHTKSY